MTRKKGSYSTKDFFEALRRAAENEDLGGIDLVLSQGGDGAYGDVVGGFVTVWQAQQPTADDLKKAICDNLGRIFRICDGIIADPKSNPKEVAWAKAKKKTASADQTKHKCDKQPIS